MHMLLLGKVIFCIGVSALRSYKIKLLSLHDPKRILCSLGLYLTFSIESTFHCSSYIGLDLSYDHTCTKSPAVTNSIYVGEWSTLFVTHFDKYLVRGCTFFPTFFSYIENDLCSYYYCVCRIYLNEYMLTVLSAEDDKNLVPSLLKHTPLTLIVWSYIEIMLFLYAKSQILI